MKAAISYAQDHRDESLNQFFEFLRIPSISTLPEHRKDIEAAADWLAAAMAEAGLKNTAVIPTEGHPAVYGEWLEAGPDAPTVLVYGHYDVQPVDPLDQWESPPFEPTIRDGMVYARGSADDKGQIFAHVKAVEALLKTEGRLPVNVKFIVEGEEEAGSGAMPIFVEANTELLAADSGLVSDTVFLKAGQPLIINGLRGIVGVEVHVSGPKGDLHSGGFGGSVHNPAQALAEIITALHDETGQVTIPGFYDKVRELSDEERAFMNDVGFDLPLWQQLTGLEKPWGEPDFTISERIGARPTCEVNGMWGGFQGEGGKTIIPARAGAKFTMRLVADQVPDEIIALFKQFIQSIAPDDLTVEVTSKESGGWPVLMPVESTEIRAASRALEATFGVPPKIMRGGGSIPIVADFQRYLKIPFVLMGFALPGNNAHAPNEYHSIENFHQSIEAIIRYYHYLPEELA